MLILGIETSCDETSAAVVKDGREIVSSIILSQDALHRQFGGVVPEIACRAHLESIVGIVHNALSDANDTNDRLQMSPTGNLRNHTSKLAM